MSGTGSIKAGLAGVAALLMLGACASRDTVAGLDQRVGALESRVNDAEATAEAARVRASQLETAANQCTATCQEASERAERIFQQSLTK